jgi:hypothetical protein
MSCVELLRLSVSLADVLIVASAEGIPICDSGA